MTCSFALQGSSLGGLGPCWVRNGVGIGLLEAVGELLEFVGEQVPVAVQRYGCRGMAEPGLDGLDAGALGDEQARAGVAKVVEPQPVGESSLDGCRLEDAGDELLLPQRTALRCGEHQIPRTLRPVGQVGGELVAQEPRQMRRAGGVGLGRPPHQPPIHLGRRLADLAASAKQVEVADTERHQLAGGGQVVLPHNPSGKQLFLEFTDDATLNPDSAFYDRTSRSCGRGPSTTRARLPRHPTVSRSAGRARALARRSVTTYRYMDVMHVTGVWD